MIIPGLDRLSNDRFPISPLFLRDCCRGERNDVGPLLLNADRFWDALVVGVGLLMIDSLFRAGPKRETKTDLETTGSIKENFDKEISLS